MKKLMFLMLIIVFIFVGCSKEEGVVTSSKLFQGDARRLEPHLDMITGCVEVKYKGDKQNLSLKYEIWEDGQLKESQDSLSVSINDNQFDGEVSLSLKENMDTNLEKIDSMKLKLVISDSTGYRSTNFTIESFDPSFGFGPVELYEAVKIKDNEEVAVWGLTAYKDVYQSGREIEESVKKADWGFILKVYFD
ncbi:hypothetical protein EDC19_1838 [Natranaerovirga hydrolytica]|uniref:Lipoprotein n=1 Tax=Natranaerovirga hydrolytica TaxID=680378 RepID=A0A4R1MRZ2_9FIRM|nr:hypothetical protein [Natranaerovirga hydrolytica]TCK92683.1 hypothetical protein EDC19_1838 [Natranaerovirga hydrolytica]